MTEKTPVTMGLPHSQSRMAKETLFLATAQTGRLKAGSKLTPAEIPNLAA
jgi:hypothetical protein